MLIPPEFVRLNRLLLFIILSSIILFYGRHFFILLTFSGFLAMLMTPLSNRLELRVSRLLSSLVSVMIILVVSSAIVFVLSAQVASISKDLPQIISGLEEIIYPVKMWINDTLGVSSEKLKDHASGAMNGAGSILTGFVKDFFTFIARFLIILVFTFLMLLNRDKYENFVVMLYREERRAEAEDMINKISRIGQQYLAGRLVAVLIMGVLYIIGFSIIGLKDAILLSAMAALITIIPYIGTLLGGLIPLLMAVISGTFNQSVWVVIIILVVNAIDHYYIEPYIVGSSVSISPFFAIVAIILGGAVWGLAGIILFLPLIGILKIIFENFESMHPYAYLIGDQRESSAHEEIFSKILKFFQGKKKVK
jgi:predicted PurR-regulated permease PerM